MKTKLIKFCLIIFVLFPLAGCIMISKSQKITPSISTSANNTASPQNTIVSPTSTSQPTITITPRPTYTPAPTQVQTLLPVELEKTVINLFENNGGCKLPCWWGMTPGETSLDDSQKFFSQFDGNLHTIGKNVLSQHQNITIPLPTVISWTKQITMNINGMNGVIEKIEIEGYDWPSYHLSQFLVQYGKPDEIWISSLYSNLGGPPPFELMLYYPQKGIFANFNSLENESEYGRGTIKACILHSPQLILWSPKKEISFQEILKIYYGGFEEYHPILPLDEATGMNIEQFYQSYKNSDVSPCFKTNRELWPEPY